MKSQRLLEILLRLQARSPRSAPELAASLGVTVRTIYRDVEALEATGVPIYTTRGAHGGIALLDGYRQAVAQLSGEEVRALFMGGTDPLVDLGMGERLARAREKLFGALSTRQREHAARTHQLIRIEPRLWGQGPQPLEALARLRTAVWNDRQIQVTYRDQSGKVSSRRLDPLGIVFKGGVWYAVARERTRTKTFRVERFLAIEVQLERFARPSDFDLDDYWERASQRYEAKAAPCRVRVRGNREHLDQMAVFWPTEIDTGAAAPSDAAEAEVTFPLRGLAIHELLAWSALLEVMAPKEMRDEITRQLAAARVRYLRTAHRGKRRGLA